MPDDLDARKEEVLKAVVDDYTVTAVPVGSQMLAHRYFARWSAATIRNELAHLVDSGHLEQPHTSSGRVPSEMGYRYFVDYLMGEETVDSQTGSQLTDLFKSLPPDLEAVLEATAMALARSADNVGVVTAPHTDEARLKHLDLVHLDGGHVLALIVLEGNLVRQVTLDLGEEVDQESLSDLSARINRDGAGLGAKKLRELTFDDTRSQDWQATVLSALADLIQSIDAQSATVVVHDGVRNLIRQPEFLDSQRLLPVLEILEHSKDLSRVLASLDFDQDVEVMIGTEIPDEHLRQCSVVITSYAGPGWRGTMGTIGPTRMRYPQVVARLRLISRLAGQTIAKIYD